MKLLIDMNLSPLWVKFFADSGYGSIHWSEIGEPWAPDGEIMDYAGANGFVIFTHDLDFGALLARRRVRARRNWASFLSVLIRVHPWPKIFSRPRI
jgi:predicted nuclease of predicted toxin-antitoxin system